MGRVGSGEVLIETGGLRIADCIRGILYEKALFLELSFLSLVPLELLWACVCMIFIESGSGGRTCLEVDGEEGSTGRTTRKRVFLRPGNMQKMVSLAL